MTNQPFENPSGEEKTPQEELEELLRQSQTTTKSAFSGIEVPESNGGRRFNWLGWAIGGLAILLLAGTIYFVVRGISFSQGTIVLDLNEDEVALTIDRRDYGEVDSGDQISLRAGEHRIHLSKTGFLELEEDFKVARGEEKVLVFDLLPVPVLETVVDHRVSYVRLSASGTEVSYFDPQDNKFKSFDLEAEDTVDLFSGRFTNVVDVVWSPVNYAAVVKLTGLPRLSNLLDNRNERGAYVPLGERPVQGPTKSEGKSTWLFDDNIKTAAGWQPILLNENIRQVAFNTDGGSIIYMYEPADGEYSLIKAWPDGLEWERVIVEMPQLDDPVLQWGRDDRYLFIEDGDRLLVADLIVKEVEDVLNDWLSGSQYAVSPDGSRIAYLADDGGAIRLKIYEMLTEERQVVKDLEVKQDTAFTWTSASSLLIAVPNQELEEINIDRDSRLTIPFVGTEEELSVVRMEYSSAGKMLMIEALEGVFALRI